MKTNEVWKQIKGLFDRIYPVMKKMFFPSAAVVWMVSLSAAAGLIYSSVRLESTEPFSVASYVLSFYALIVLCLRTPNMIAFVQRFRRENRYYLRYMEDVRLRMNLSLFGALSYNAIYAVFQLALGIYYHSVWFYAMAGYYALLAGVRLILGMYVRERVPGEAQAAEWKKYRLCGVGLVAMNLALLVFIGYFVLHLRAVHHHEIVMIAMAAYTFGSLTWAILSTVRSRRYNSPVCSAAKALSLASAAVSMLSLEDAMLTTFATEDQALFRRFVVGATGAAAILFILGMAVYMIVRATKKLNREPL